MTPIAYYSESLHPDDGLLVWIRHKDGDVLAGIIPPEDEDDIRRIKEVLPEKDDMFARKHPPTTPKL